MFSSPVLHVPVKLNIWIAGANNDSTVLDLVFSEWWSQDPYGPEFTVPAICPANPVSKKPVMKNTMATRILSTVSQVGIHWKCDACKIAVETLISAGCDAGSAICGPFVAACDLICDSGCEAAGCSDWACTKIGAC